MRLYMYEPLQLGQYVGMEGSQYGGGALRGNPVHGSSYATNVDYISNTIGIAWQKMRSVLH